MRDSWDRYFMDMAFAASKRSTCNRLHVGAVIVKNNRVKATGYNGSPAGLPHCIDDECYMHNGHCVRCIHAEVNALLECSPDDKYGATIYVTDEPCSECQKLIITSGINRVVYARAYSPEINWFSLAKHIKVEQYIEE